MPRTWLCGGAGKDAGQQDHKRPLHHEARSRTAGPTRAGLEAVHGDFEACAAPHLQKHRAGAHACQVQLRGSAPPAALHHQRCAALRLKARPGLRSGGQMGSERANARALWRFPARRSRVGGSPVCRDAAAELGTPLGCGVCGRASPGALPRTPATPPAPPAPPRAAAGTCDVERGTRLRDTPEQPAALGLSCPRQRLPITCGAPCAPATPPAAPSPQRASAGSAAAATSPASWPACEPPPPRAAWPAPLPRAYRGPATHAHVGIHAKPATVARWGVSYEERYHDAHRCCSRKSLRATKPRHAAWIDVAAALRSRMPWEAIQRRAAP